MSSSSKEKDSLAQTVTQGTIYITIAKLYFIASSYIIYFALPRLISAELFGVYGFVISIVSIINVVIVTGTQQTVSKFVSQDYRQADAIKKQVLKLQIFLVGIVTILYIFSIPLIAKSFNDNSLIRPLQISVLIPIFYSFYAVYVGYLNGQRKFLRQSILDIAYSTLKAVGIVTLALISKSVNGALLGFALATTLVFLISPIVAGKAVNQEINVKPSIKDFLRFQSELLGAILISNLLQRTDLILIKKYISENSVIASQMAGYYTALTTIAGVIYQTIVSVAFVIFPIISKATFEQKKEEVKGYICQTTKYTLMLMALCATIFSSNSKTLLEVLYRTEYTIGALALSVVAYGTLFFGMIYILTTIISSSGKPRVSFLIFILTLLSSIILNIILIPKYQLVGAAVATTISMFIGIILATIYVHKTFKASFYLKSVVSICLAIVITYLLNFLLPTNIFHLTNKLGTLVNLAIHVGIQTITYLLILVITKELGNQELGLLRKVAKI